MIACGKRERIKNGMYGNETPGWGGKCGTGMCNGSYLGPFVTFPIDRHMVTRGGDENT